MRLLASVRGLAPEDPFSEVLSTVLPAAPFSARLALLAEQGEAAACDWIFHVAGDERPSGSAIGRAALAMPRYDAVFGALETGTPPALWRPSRLAFDERERLPHALLQWWVGETLFARTAILRALCESGALDGPTTADTLLALWHDTAAVKLAQPLSRRDDPPSADAREREAVIAHLARDPARIPIRFADRIWHLPYGGRNAGIEREQTRGLFFEQHELVFLADRLGPGRVVADVGANTGNHTVFFAGPMRASRVVPFEPVPETARLLRLAVEWNALSNVDLTHLDLGIGAGDARMRAVPSERGGLGATRLEPDPDGAIVVRPLDEVLTGPVDFLKIDVEAMELEVLRGAAGLIDRCRPLIFIEIAEPSANGFRDWLSANAYQVERVFSDKKHTNLLVAPAVP